MYQSLSIDDLRLLLRNFTRYDLLAITLINGNVLLGGLYKVIADLSLELIYNSKQGTEFGHSSIVEIPFNIIANITHISLDSAEYNTLPKSYPNPLASIIYTHNDEILVKIQPGLNRYGLVEQAFSKNAISQNGIKFKRDFIFYIDEPFLNRSSGGDNTITITAIPFIEYNRSMAHSVEEAAHEILKVAKGVNVANNTNLSSVGQYISLNGLITGEDMNESDLIEGEECYVWEITDGIKNAKYPVLMKHKLLKYPAGFITDIRSEISFFGEVIPLPLQVLGEQYEEIFLARIAGYIAY